MRKHKLILAASIGKCVHVAGVLNFLRLAEECGYKTKFLGPAVSIDYLLNAVEETDPYIVAVGYRLTAEAGYRILKKLKNSVFERGLNSTKYIFGGTLPVARKAEEVGLFDIVFNGQEELPEIIDFLEGRDYHDFEQNYETDLLLRLENKKPYPLIRHHFGLPSIEETVVGITEIAKSKVLDIISLGPDQYAQESFFRPDEIEKDEMGAGGVPIRNEEDLQTLYRASRTGNFPLMRSYSGTRDIIKMAEVLLKNINNAWCAVPLSWYNQLDGRGPRTLLESIIENQQLMKWHGDRDVPVEVNEAHHWSLRDAHDTIAVVMAYLAALNAKKMGVKTYIAQYMFNTPNGTSAEMDIAKMAAKKYYISDLEDNNFRVLTQVRAGLSSFPVNLKKAKGQLAYSTFLGMSLDPDIVHVVAFSEADHAARAGDIIESCHIAQQVINNLTYGSPDFISDPRIIKRRDMLIEEAEILLDAIRKLDRNTRHTKKAEFDNPLTDPIVLESAIKIGLIDAPHLKGNREATGKLSTKLINGACFAYNYQDDKIIYEKERIEKIHRRQKFE